MTTILTIAAGLIDKIGLTGTSMHDPVVAFTVLVAALVTAQVINTVFWLVFTFICGFIGAAAS